MPLKLPYFDMILSRLQAGDAEFEDAFGRHVHFGAWEDPDNAYEDQPDSIRAMDRLCQHLIGLAEIRDNQAVLDVGCGFGGTLAALDQQFSPVCLTGINIDERQLQVAAERLTPRSGNTLELVLGDACDMPFADASFDRILAVECIFHFSSRKRFFEQVRRVLRPGGNLTLTDFVQPVWGTAGQFDHAQDWFWGPSTTIDVLGYHALADEVGLSFTHAYDISHQVRPTYHWFGKVLGKHFPEAREAIMTSREVMDAGGVGYCTLRFDRI